MTPIDESHAGYLRYDRETIKKMLEGTIPGGKTGIEKGSANEPGNTAQVSAARLAGKPIALCASHLGLPIQIVYSPVSAKGQVHILGCIISPDKDHFVLIRPRAQR